MSAPRPMNQNKSDDKDTQSNQTFKRHISKTRQQGNTKRHLKLIACRKVQNLVPNKIQVKVTQKNEDEGRRSNSRQTEEKRQPTELMKSDQSIYFLAPYDRMITVCVRINNYKKNAIVEATRPKKSECRISED
ncbi:hypothetical protein RUM43_012503 [Polyplax serrata]|uniref:Uncharacterized protein n=1 Tax=Polyplax serrata TaxID=468196 RepID=A0AAN8P3X1_POLSC